MLDPAVSVVVSTYNRPELLARLLAGLRAQTLARERYEVIVVDNGSDPPTGALLAATEAAGDLPLRSIRHERTRGPSGGRNSGWRAARAPLVAFTDDDCVPAPGWLQALLEAAAEHPGQILQGRTQPDPDGRPHANPLLIRTRRIDGPTPQYETCNVAYPRSLLEELGGFDESYGRRPAGEDTDLAWRALERGHRSAFVPEALVHHANLALTLADAMREALRWGDCARLFARHPGTRVILYRRVFWNVWHYLLLRSILALAGPAWLRRQLVSGHLLALWGRATGAGAGPQWMLYLLAYDALEAAGMLRGGLRHRTPLL